jgi:hypothetical protein
MIGRDRIYSTEKEMGVDVEYRIQIQILHIFGEHTFVMKESMSQNQSYILLVPVPEARVEPCSREEDH